MFATIVFTSYSDLLDLISVSTRIDHHISMQKYDRECTSGTNWFDLVGTPSLVFESEPLNTLERIDVILAAMCEEEPLEAYFWEQSTVPSPSNTYWTDAAREGGRLYMNNPVLGPHWTRYTGAHSGLPCDPEEPCDCEGHHCAGTLSSIGHAVAAAPTAHSLGIPLIVVVPPTLTPSEIDTYNWQW